MKNFCMVMLAALVAVGLAQQPRVTPFHGSFWGIGDFVPANTGARGMGMGGCNIASAEGYQALLKNPAGVAHASRNEFGVTGRAVFSDVDYGDDYGRFGIDHRLWGLGAACPVDLPHSLRAGFALAWGAYYDNSYRQQTWDDQEEEGVREVGGYNVLLPTVSLCYDDRWSLGLSLGLPVMSTYAHIEVSSGHEWELSGQVTGTLVQLGACARPWPWLRVGACLAPPLELTIDEPERDTVEYKDVNIDVPSQQAIGVAFTPARGLTLAAEYAYLPLKHMEWDGYRWPGYEMSAPYDGIDDGAIWRVGVEYEWFVRLRVGGNWSNYWMRYESAEDRPAQIGMVTVGLGFDVGPVTVDIAAEYGHQDVDEYPNEEFTFQVGRVALDIVYSMSGWGVPSE